jgi:hypothetical protein
VVSKYHGLLLKSGSICYEGPEPVDLAPKLDPLGMQVD